MTNPVTHSVSDGVSSPAPYPYPSRNNVVRAPSSLPAPPSERFQGSTTAPDPDYDAYLDSMLAHLGRVHTEATIAYHWRRLEEARAA